MRVLIDTNVVLDVLLDRDPFADAAARIFAQDPPQLLAVLQTM